MNAALAAFSIRWHKSKRGYTGITKIM